MAFDPDAYIAAASPAATQEAEFDPDAYIADQAASDISAKGKAYKGMGVFPESWTDVPQGLATGALETISGGISGAIAEKKGAPMVGAESIGMRAPYSTLAGEVAGAALPLGELGTGAKLAVKTAGKGLGLMRSAWEAIKPAARIGATYGAAAGAGEAYKKGEELPEALKSTATGAAIGAAAGAGLGGAAAAVSPAVKAAASLMREQVTARIAERTGKPLITPERVEGIAGALTPSRGPFAAKKALPELQATKKAVETVGHHLPVLRAEMKETGQSMNTVEGFLAGTRKAKTDIWAKYKDMFGNDVQVNSQPVADAIRSVAENSRLKEFHPDTVAALNELATRYDGKVVTAAIADEERKALNAELAPLYAKTGKDKYKAEMTDPEWQAIQKARNAFSQAIDAALEQHAQATGATTGIAPAELRKQYGAWSVLEDRAERLVAEQIKSSTNLTGPEILTLIAAAGSGEATTAMKFIGMGKFIKWFRSPNARLQRAMAFMRTSPGNNIWTKPVEAHAGKPPVMPFDKAGKPTPAKLAYDKRVEEHNQAVVLAHLSGEPVSSEALNNVYNSLVVRPQQDKLAAGLRSLPTAALPGEGEAVPAVQDVSKLMQRSAESPMKPRPESQYGKGPGWTSQELFAKGKDIQTAAAMERADHPSLADDAIQQIVQDEYKADPAQYAKDVAKFAKKSK